MESAVSLEFGKRERMAFSRPSLDPRSDQMSNAVIAQLILQNNLMYRTSTVVLIIFNILAAGFVIFLIVFDTRKVLRNHLLPCSPYVRPLFISRLHGSVN